MNEEMREQTCELQGPVAPLPEDPVPAMAYVPFQQWDGELICSEDALSSGTLFPVLDKPFCGRRFWQ